MEQKRWPCEWPNSMNGPALCVPRSPPEGEAGPVPRTSSIPARIGRRQMKGFGGMLTFDVASVEAALTNANVKLMSLAESLGGVETLIIRVDDARLGTAGTSHRSGSRPPRSHSAGIQEAEDLIAGSRTDARMVIAVPGHRAASAARQHVRSPLALTSSTRPPIVNTRRCHQRQA